MSDTPLQNFITKARNFYKQIRTGERIQIIHVVLGNEACDLDSAVSALCYAFLLDAEASQDEIILPVINTCRDDFPLKTEVEYFLTSNGLNSNHLLFRDEVDLAKLHEVGRLRLILVDHHVLAVRDKSLADSVVEVVDHRPRDSSQEFPDHVKLDIRIVGSCSSLVGDKLISRYPSLMDKQVSTLIFGTILLDTACFSKEADRATPLDVSVVEWCEGRFNFGPRSDTFQKLVEVRRDISRLSSLQLLHKDLKIVKNLPIPGIPLLVKDFLTRPKAVEALEQFCEKHNTSAAVVIGMCFLTGNLRRDIAVFSKGSDQLAQKLVNALLAASFLRLTVVPSEDFPSITLFQQDNLKASRKQILPVVKEALDEKITVRLEPTGDLDER